MVRMVRMMTEKWWQLRTFNKRLQLSRDVSILSCIQTRLSGLRPRPRTRTRPSHYNTIQSNTTTGWLFASGSSWTLGHTGGSRQDTHGTPVPEREGRGWPTTCTTTDDRQTDDKPSDKRAFSKQASRETYGTTTKCWQSPGILQFHWNTLMLRGLLILIWMCYMKRGLAIIGMSIRADISQILGKGSRNSLHSKKNLQRINVVREGDWPTIQTTTRPDCVWPEVWTKIGKAVQNGEKPEWAKEKPKLDNARNLWGRYFVGPDDGVHKGILKTWGENLKNLWLHPCRAENNRASRKWLRSQRLDQRRIPKQCTVV